MVYNIFLKKSPFIYTVLYVHKKNFLLDNNNVIQWNKETDKSYYKIINCVTHIIWQN